MKIISRNKKAYFDYQVLEKYEAGLVLTGAEIKAIRESKVNLTGSYVKIYGKKLEMWWVGGHISTDDPIRSRKLLLHRGEIKKLIGQSQQKGLTLVPLALYLKKNRAKLEIGLCRGKKLHDKREVLKKRDLERELKNQRP